MSKGPARGGEVFVFSCSAAELGDPQDLQLVVIQRPVEFIEDRFEQAGSQFVEGRRLLVGRGGRERQDFLGRTQALPAEAGLDAHSRVRFVEEDLALFHPSLVCTIFH